MNKRCLYCVGLAAIVVILLVLASATAVAAPSKSPPEPPFQFAEEEGVEFTWKEVKAGKAIVPIWNNGTTTLTLTVKLSDMGFKDYEGKDGRTADFLKPASETITLAPASSAKITLTATDHVVLCAGSYAGYVHVSDGDTAIHLPIKIIAAKGSLTSTTVETGEPPVPLVDTWKVRHYRVLPWLAVGITTNRYLPLDLDPHVGRDIALDPDAPLGYLTAPRSGMARVGWTGSPKTKPYNKQAIKLTFQDLRQVGEYTGEIDTLPDDSEKGTVTVTAEVTDLIVWPILAILAGIGLAWWVKNRLNVNRPLLKLHEDWYDTKVPHITKAHKGYSIEDSFKEQTGKIREAIEKLQQKAQWSTVTLGADNEPYQKIVESLQKLEEQVADWGRFGKELERLEEALEDAKSYLDEKEKPQTTGFEVTPFYKYANKRLTEGEPLALEEADVELPEEEEASQDQIAVQFKERRTDILECTATARSWRDWYLRHEKAKKDYKEAVKPKVKQRLLKTALDTAFELSRVHCLLKHAEKPADFEAAEMEQRLRTAEGLVAGLKCIRPEELPSNWLGIELEAKEKEALEAIDLETLRGLLAGFSPLTALAAPTVLPGDAAEPLAAIRRRLMRNDALMLLLQIAIAVAVALGTQYFDKTWGTWVDWITALGLGFATATAFEAVFAAVNRLLGASD